MILLAMKSDLDECNIQRIKARAKKEAKLKAKRNTMHTIPEDDEYFSTDVKYKFDFDKKKIKQSNIVEIYDDKKCSDGNNTELIKECKKDSCNLNANGDISSKNMEDSIIQDHVEDTGIE